MNIPILPMPPVKPAKKEKIKRIYEIMIIMTCLLKNLLVRVSIFKINHFKMKYS